MVAAPIPSAASAKATLPDERIALGVAAVPSAPAILTGSEGLIGPPVRTSRAGLVIVGLIGLVGIAGLALGVINYDDPAVSPVDTVSVANGMVSQAAMCQTIAVASVGNGPDAIPTMPGGQQDLAAMQAAEVQVYQWADKTQAGTLRSELEQENSDAQRFISDYDANPDRDAITPTGVLSLDMSTFTIDQTKVDATCGISTKGTGGLSA